MLKKKNQDQNPILQPKKSEYSTQKPKLKNKNPNLNTQTPYLNAITHI